MEKTYNGITWKGLKCTFEGEKHHSHTTITCDVKNDKAKEFWVNITAQCEAFVKQNPEEWKRLEEARKELEEY